VENLPKQREIAPVGSAMLCDALPTPDRREAKQNYTKTENAFVLDTNVNKIVNILYGNAGYSRF